MLARRVMTSLLACFPRFRVSPSLLLVFGLIGLATPTAGPTAAQEPGKQPVAKGLPPLDPDAVTRAVQQGVEFLRRSQQPQGHWGAGTGPGSDKGWAVGYTCLAGLALVECGVSTNDPGLKLAVSGIRHHANELDSTYEVALAILFLDRMGEKSDARIIQGLAGRLIAGQTPTGGWGYKVPKYSAAESTALLSALRRFSPPLPPAPPSVRERPASLPLCIKATDDTFLRVSPPFDAARARKQAIASLPTKMKKLPVLFEPDELILEEPKDSRSDNSNTHFAILGLWASRRHDVPADRAFGLLAQRFRTSQGKDGSWSYEYVRGGANGAPQMTCIALLGLAIGHVLNPDVAVRPEKDPKVVNAFAALSPRIGEPAGRFDNRPSIKDVGGLYFLWAMERIAVLYDVRQLDKKDWYRWGAEILIGHQGADGSWQEEGGYPGQHPVLNTALAILFLKRANLTPDLSRRLTVDTAALTAKVDDKVSPRPVTPAPRKEPEPTPVVVEPPPAPKKETPAPTRPVTPPVTAPVADTSGSTSTPTKSESNGAIWVVLFVALALVGGGLVFFGLRSRTNGNEDERPRKKKGTKKKVRAVEDDED